MKEELNETSDSTTFKHEVKINPQAWWRTWLIGHPLPTGDAPHQTIGKMVGLAVFASDALSSTAYATQEMLVILAAAGTLALGYAFPLSMAIVALMAIVIVSYEQTIHAYPSGGGAYVVARENIGDLPAQVAGSALLIDYVLTVAVSISSGVAQIVSAYPVVFQYRVPLAIVLVMFVMLVNLRGVRESGMAFAIPSYIFLLMMILNVVVGLFQYFTGGLGTVMNPPALEIVGPVAVLTPFLLLHAFASGTSAMTGIEAIANGVTAFKEPRSRNAGVVLIWMGSILSFLFLGISFLATRIQAVPSEYETVISQLARTVFNGTGIFYTITIAMTAVILVMAGNTAFAGFPRLAAILAKDGFLPRQLTYRGSRLVFSRGIMLLALASSALILVFDASVTRLIPLYAIGVFLSFTLSQIGMAYRWWKVGHLAPGEERVEASSVLRNDPKWQVKMVANSFGAFATAIVTLVFGFTKFHDGAWIVVVVIPFLALIFSRIHLHYRTLASKLSLQNRRSLPRISHQRVILPISGVHQGTLEGLRYARSLSTDITAVYISIDPEQTHQIEEKWSIYGEGIRLVVLDSQYRVLVEPLVSYIVKLAKIRQPNEIITVVVPQFVSHSFWTSILHSQTGLLLRSVLLLQPGVVVIEVPYQVD